jgi:hypothetical protein
MKKRAHLTYARWTRRIGLVAAALAASAAALAGPADAQPMVGLRNTDSIFTFDSATPGSITSDTLVTSLDPGDHLIAIDRNPSDGQLYGLGAESRVYEISEAGVASQVGSQPFAPALTSVNADIDFDPRYSRAARITTDTDQNLIWLDGFAYADTNIAWAPGDPNAASNPAAFGLAYSNNFPQATSSTPYVYHYTNDQLATLGSVGGSPDAPSSGLLHTVGSSGVSAEGVVLGLDESPDGTMFALLRTDIPTTATRLFKIDKATGAATPVTGDAGTSLVGTGTNTATDIATDPVSNNFKLSAASYSVGESDRKATLTITRGQSLGAASVQWATSNGSAISGRDYTAQQQQLQFQNGEASKTVDIPIRSDLIDEGDETFDLTLSSPHGGHAATVSPASATVTIADDDTGPPPSAKITALTTTNELVTFDSATSGNVSAPLPVTGLVAGEELVAIDRRPATGQLYGLTQQSRLYTIDETSGAASQVGTGQFSPSLASQAVGFDFDPVADRIRIVSSSGGQNLRLDPTTGLATADSPAVFDAADPNAAFTPTIAALAYTNNVPGATGTTLFGYDYNQDSLVRVGSVDGVPNPAASGAVATIGRSGVSSQPAVNLGMDIGTDGTAWALIRVSGGVAQINVVDLTTGLTSLVGDVGAGANIYRDITLPALSQTVQLSGDSYNGSENDGAAKVTVTRSQTKGEATVEYATSDGSATVGSDYTATTGTLTFAAGDASKDISIPVTNDASSEGPETLTLTISHARGGDASVGSPAAATVTIADDGTAATGGGGADTTKPVVSTCHKSRQQLTKQKAVIVCIKSSEDGSASAAGKVAIAGVKKPVSLRKVGKAVTKGAKRVLRLRLPAKVLAALERQGKATARVTIKVRDAAGNETRVSRRIKAKPAAK